MPKPKTRAGRRNRRASSIGVLAALCVLAMLSAGALYSTNGNWGFMDVDGLFNMGAKKNAGSSDALPIPPEYKMAGVQLGMSPDAVKKQHPDMKLATVSDGVARGSYFMDGASYAVWFLEVNGEKQAYRMRVDKSFPAGKDQELLNSMAKTYGRPSSSDCDSNPVAVNRSCSFNWLGKKGVSLAIRMRNVRRSDGTARLDVSMDVIDTLLEGKRLRQQSGFFGAPLTRRAG